MTKKRSGHTLYGKISSILKVGIIKLISQYELQQLKKTDPELNSSIPIWIFEPTKKHQEAFGFIKISKQAETIQPLVNIIWECMTSFPEFEEFI